jgi:hypothetical protein
MIGPNDLDLLTVTDSIEEARDVLVLCYNQHCSERRLDAEESAETAAKAAV